MRPLASAALLLALAVTPAFADTFTITEPTRTITFSLPSSPTPDAYLAGVGFLVNNVTLNVGGASELETLVFSPNALNIGSAAMFTGIGGFDVSNPISSGSFGLPFYTGSEATPTFTPGTYNGGDVDPDGTETLVIAAPTSPSTVTPEPASLALLGTGLAGLLRLTRRRPMPRG